MPRPRRSRAAWLSAALLAIAGEAGAADVTDVASSGEKDHPFGGSLRVGYEYLAKTAAIKREHEGEPGQTTVNVLKDLVYRQATHRMNLRAELGIYHDLALALELPLVLADSRTLEYDQRRGGGCVFAGPGADCVDADNSLSTNNEATGNHADWDPRSFDNPGYILPFGGYDAVASAAGQGPAGFAPGSTTVLRGVSRGGSGADLLDTLNFALRWAPLSQARDDTKPTWVLALEYHLSVGNVMAFDRKHPDANHAVADGLDHVIARTALSHRFRYFDPYIEVWFDYPFARRSDTLFLDLGRSGKNAQPQMSGGTRFGVEIVPFERPRPHVRIAIDASARILGHFDGRGYSEIWEMLASSPALACDPQWNPSCSPSSVDPNTQLPWGGTTAYQDKAFNGLTTIENYASIGGELALVLQATRWVRLRAWFTYQRDQGHLLTTDDVGKPAVTGGRVATPAEYNPAFRPVINEVGRRYRADDIDVLGGGVWAQWMF